MQDVQDNEGNKLLELRSNAGTHDLAMGRDVLERLLNAGEGDEVRRPCAPQGTGLRITLDPLNPGAYPTQSTLMLNQS